MPTRWLRNREFQRHLTELKYINADYKRQMRPTNLLTYKPLLLKLAVGVGFKMASSLEESPWQVVFLFIFTYFSYKIKYTYATITYQR